MNSAPEQRTEGGPTEESPAEEVAELPEEDLTACSEEPEGPDDGGLPRTRAGAGTDPGPNHLEIFGGSILDLTDNVPGRPVPPHRSLVDAMAHYYGDYVGTARRLHAAHSRRRIDDEAFENTCRALQKWFLDNLRAIRIINDGPPEMPSRILTSDEKRYITEMCAEANRPWTKKDTLDSLREHCRALCGLPEGRSSRRNLG